jgi:hypothetical protein
MTNTDSESDEDSDSENEQLYEPSKNPTKERQSDSFRNINPNRLPNHFQYLPIQRKTYITKQNKTTTTYLQRQISGWLL